MERAGDEVAPLPHSGAGQQQQVRDRGEAPELLAGTAQTPQAQLPLPGRPAPAWRTRGSGALGRRAKRGRRGGSSRGPAGRMRGRGRTAGAVGPAAGLAGVASPGTAVAVSQLARGSRRDGGPWVSVGSSETGVRTGEASAVCGRCCPRPPSSLRPTTGCCLEVCLSHLTVALGSPSDSRFLHFKLKTLYYLLDLSLENVEHK